MSVERDYDLAILVILLVLCWPAALIYYYTRPEKPTYNPYGWQQPQQQWNPNTGTRVCPGCNNMIPGTATWCPHCGTKQS